LLSQDNPGKLRPMQLVKEFKDFIARGNVLDLAVGVIIGGAFGKIVDSIVKDLIMPAIGMIGGQPDFSALVWGAHKEMVNGVEVIKGGIMVGNFLNSVVSFLILALVVFFAIVKPANLFIKKQEAVPSGPPPATLDDVVKAIRDLKA
jgi:large conductance mechanosensitive channel